MIYVGEQGPELFWAKPTPKTDDPPPEFFIEVECSGGITLPPISGMQAI